MCLTIDTKFHPMLEPKIADRNILVWKVLDKNKASVVFLKRYRPNKVYSVRMAVTLFSHSIDEGFHAYRSRNRARIVRLYNEPSGAIVVKMWIPEGAEYFIGRCGDIVSNKIKTGDLKNC